MRIDTSDPEGFAGELVDQCMASRDDRAARYSALRSYFLFGTAEEGVRAPYNKIHSHLELLSSYLYAAQTVRFEVDAEVHTQSPLDRIGSQQASALTEYLNDEFHDSDSDQMIAIAVLWSLVWDTMILKPHWRAPNGVGVWLVRPFDFGVLREDRPTLTGQEAMCHTYRMSRRELHRTLVGMGHSSETATRLANGAGDSSRGNEDQEGVRSLIITQSTPTMSGVLNGSDSPGRNLYRPKVEEELVEINELWVWDDSANDWRMMRYIEPGILLTGAKPEANPFLEGAVPFVKMTPHPLPDYFWGVSEIAQLLMLQEWLNERIASLRNMEKKEDKTPRIFSGFGGITDEKARAMNDPGAFFSDTQPNGKIQDAFKGLPPTAYESIAVISSLFSEQSGISPILQGHGEAGVRGHKHAEKLASLAGARLKKQAGVIERPIEIVGDLIFRLLAEHEAKHLTAKSGLEFTAEQFKEVPYKIRVDAHSSSPIFVDSTVALAFELAQEKAIDGESLLDLTHPPQLDQLKQRWETMQQKEAEAARQAAAQAGHPPGAPRTASKS